MCNDMTEAFDQLNEGACVGLQCFTMLYKAVTVTSNRLYHLFQGDICNKSNEFPSK